MELSLITPIAHLKQTQLLPGRFCIAPVAARFGEYRKYFKNASIDGYKVILDNGVFENNKMGDSAYIDLACKMQPAVLVIPDTINAGAQENWEAALQFIEKAKIEDLKDTELMFVIQCERNDIDGFWAALDQSWTDENIKWFGICRDAVRNAFGQWTHTDDQELNRFYFAAALQKRYEVDAIAQEKWHFLGVGARWDLLQYYWFVDSMDTASVFYQSILGNLITEEGHMPEKLKRPGDYFLRTFSDKQHWLPMLQENCQRALLAAQAATANRKKILGERL